VCFTSFCFLFLHSLSLSLFSWISANTFDPLLLWQIWPRNYNNEPSSGHVRETSMCLQLPALTSTINIETAPKKEYRVAQLGHRVTHICVLLAEWDDDRCKKERNVSSGQRKERREW
jgi:hypothetical protein